MSFGSKFVSVLKKIGTEVGLVAQTVPVYGAAIQAASALIPSTSPDTNAKITTGLNAVNDGLIRFQNIIVDAEIMGQTFGAPGSQKATMAGPAVAQLFMDLPLIKGKKPKDPEQTKKDAAELAGALAKFINGWEG